MRIIGALLAASISIGHAAAAELVVPMNLIDASGTVKAIGNVTVSETTYGLVFTPALEGLPAGVHGFHVHENGSCDPQVKDGQPVAGLAAGGHYDPAGTKRHGTPWGDGHLGDLPGLVVDHDGRASYAVLAPRLKKLDELKARALMIHVGGDNHADHPMPLGGGGARLACGVIGG
jgi:Cu-Zn family superoxide dismutase